jgi:hypothetical protein
MESEAIKQFISIIHTAEKCSNFKGVSTIVCKKLQSLKNSQNLRQTVHTNYPLPSITRRDYFNSVYCEGEGFFDFILSDDNGKMLAKVNNQHTDYYWETEKIIPYREKYPQYSVIKIPYSDRDSEILELCIII